jgi:hypothetical protein
LFKLDREILLESRCLAMMDNLIEGFVPGVFDTDRIIHGFYFLGYGFTFYRTTNPIEQLNNPTTSRERQLFFKNNFSHIPYIHTREPYPLAKTFHRKNYKPSINADYFFPHRFFFQRPFFPCLHLIANYNNFITAYILWLINSRLNANRYPF